MLSACPPEARRSPERLGALTYLGCAADRIRTDSGRRYFEERQVLLRKGVLSEPTGLGRGRKPLPGLKPASLGCLSSGRPADRFSRSRIRKHPQGRFFEHFQGCVTPTLRDLSNGGSAEWMGVKTAFRETCSVPGRNDRF